MYPTVFLFLQIVPTAIIVARQGCKVEEAKKLLSAHSVVRTAMASCFCLK